MNNRGIPIPSWEAIWMLATTVLITFSSLIRKKNKAHEKGINLGSSNP